MALRAKSLFLYGFQVTPLNRSIDFKSSMGGIERQGTLRLGFYTLTSLANEIASAMNSADPANEYFVTIDRTYASGYENRVTIFTNTTPYLDLLFGTGSRNATSVRTLIGFNAIDYTGLTSYIGNTSAGVALSPDLIGYNYLGPEFIRNIFGSVNIATDGSKESIVFQVQRFIQVQFKYEPQSKVATEWMGLMNYIIQQRPFEFTPEVTSPNVYYQCTLEQTTGDGKGLGYIMREMLPMFPFHYDTGLLKFRQIVPPGGFI